MISRALSILLSIFNSPFRAILETRHFSLTERYMLMAVSRGTTVVLGLIINVVIKQVEGDHGGLLRGRTKILKALGEVGKLVPMIVIRGISTLTNTDPTLPRGNGGSRRHHARRFTNAREEHTAAAARGRTATPSTITTGFV